jgi:RHS repeat-associated protein
VLTLPSLTDYYPETATAKSSSFQAEGAGSSGRILFWYHPDYLGNVDLVTEIDGFAHEFFIYNPWGEEMHQWNANTYAFTSPYRFNSKELDPETGLAYYGARYYQNKIGMWLSVDPLALEGHNVTKTPFHFSSNNPSMRIDPDGLSDYFTEDGTFLGSDNSEFDDVRIMSREIWNRYSTEDINGVRSISEEIGVNASNIATKSNLNIESQLSIYQHYNPMNIELKDSDSRTDIGANFRGYSDGRSELLIHVCRNESQQIIDHFEQISSIFAHEKRHYDDFRELGFEGYKQTPHDVRERRAYQAQLEHSSWSKVSRDFKSRVLKTAVNEYNFIEPIQVPIKSINIHR